MTLLLENVGSDLHLADQPTITGNTVIIFSNGRASLGTNTSATKQTSDMSDRTPTEARANLREKQNIQRRKWTSDDSLWETRLPFGPKELGFALTEDEAREMYHNLRDVFNAEYGPENPSRGHPVPDREAFVALKNYIHYLDLKVGTVRHDKDHLNKPLRRFRNSDVDDLANIASLERAFPDHENVKLLTLILDKNGIQHKNHPPETVDLTTPEPIVVTPESTEKNLKRVRSELQLARPPPKFDLALERLQIDGGGTKKPRNEQSPGGGQAVTKTKSAVVDLAD